MYILIFLFFGYVGALRNLTIGLLFVKDVPTMEVAIGYRTSASAVLIAKDRIRQEHLLDGFDIQFVYDFDECDEMLGASKTIDLIFNKSVHAIFGPTCNRPGMVAATIASNYRIPIFEWGLTTSQELVNSTRYPTVLPFSVNSYTLAMSIIGLLRQFDWDEYVFLYSKDENDDKCSSLESDIQTVNSLNDDISLIYTYRIPNNTFEAMREAIRAVKTRGRVIIICVPSGPGLKKAIMAATMRENANSSEYVYIMAETNSRGFVVDEMGGGTHYLWEQPIDLGMTDEESRRSFDNLLFLVDNMGLDPEHTVEYDKFSKQVIARMKEAPFQCIDDCSSSAYSSAAKYASQLADSFYAYAVALNKTLISHPDVDLKNGTAILDHIAMTFQGFGGGDILVDRDAARRQMIYLIGLNASFLPQTYAKLQVNYDVTVFEAFYENELEIWNGPRPNIHPICGYAGTSCPPNFIRDYLVYTIIVGVLIILAVICALLCLIFAVRTKQVEMINQDKLWQVSYIELSQISRKSTEASQHSFASGPLSTSTRYTTESKTETNRFLFLIYKNEVIAANKHSTKIELTPLDKFELRKMREINHDNLNMFIGLCQDGPQLLSIWRFCARRSLADVIERSSMQMDGFFILSLVRDIAAGLGFIHSSVLEFHGYLTSKSCLIDDRWQVKISDYGLKNIRAMDPQNGLELLWSAPEILRSDDKKKSKEGDIYSFGVISSEIITKKSVFDFNNRNEKVEELLYLIKKGGHNPCRPSLEIEETLDVNPALLHLVRDCWTERPSERPNVDQVKSVLKSLNNGQKGNLMDHVFNMLESYASNLEEEVSERMKELVEEKKKSDILLYRMLPKSVADRLKTGQSIKPETFELVTIFFSDVVQFTTLASKCTPLQVVQLLNDLYTIFDSIIEKHDVYKVETIGDGYLCVSGLPHRNGMEHCRHIARMSLELLSSLEHFRVAHLPSERINLRIGLHCGSVVAGVVGLTMPRFCLFGDAVNTASRMESNGKPGKIHISSDANNLLTTGGFNTEPRGEVIIKGKGVMETFWLLNGF